MKTLKIKKLRSGNYEIVNNTKEATHKFNTQKAFINWFETMSTQKCNTWDSSNKTFKYAGIVKARYSKSQTHFNSANEVIEYCKKSGLI